jgi:DNA-binding response OmpR family regulator
MALRFGPCTFDAARRQPMRGETPIHLTPKAFDARIAP